MKRNSGNARSKIKIGTRGSKLALAQAEQVRDLLCDTCGFVAQSCEIIPIATRGDTDKARPVRHIGGKGVFCREIESALMEGRVDIAVHSLKDLPVQQPEGLVVDCILKREDPRDALVSERFAEIDLLPEGAVVGTSSLRRKAQLLRLRPDLDVIDFRGNVDTRLRKLLNGDAHAILLACAGLKRLGKFDAPATPVPFGSMLPAAAQGAICIERRRADDWTRSIASSLNDQVSALQIRAERAFLAGIGGSCDLPVAALGTIDDGSLVLSGEVLRADGTDAVSHLMQGPVEVPEKIGYALAVVIKNEIGRDLENWMLPGPRS